jgi:hypothetical protein
MFFLKSRLKVFICKWYILFFSSLAADGVMSTLRLSIGYSTRQVAFLLLVMSILFLLVGTGLGWLICLLSTSCLMSDGTDDGSGDASSDPGDELS